MITIFAKIPCVWDFGNITALGAGTLAAAKKGFDLPDKISHLVKLIKQPQGYVVLTGEFSASDRLTSSDIFNAMGLSIAGSVSSKTSFLLVGEGFKQSKVDQALSRKIPVFSEDEFWAAVDLVFPADKN